MKKQSVKKWIVQEQGKHFCQCGCNEEIIIQKQHHYRGIPLYLVGHNHKNKILSEETKKKISNGRVGKYKGENNGFYGKHHTKETKEINRLSHTGKNNHNWQGGISLKYCYKFNKDCKESNRNKFNKQCFLCGKLEEDNITKTDKLYNLDVHHIDYNKQQGCGFDWKLVPLCRSCHMKTGGNENRKHYEWLLSTLLYIREMILEYKNKIDYRSLNI